VAQVNDLCTGALHHAPHDIDGGIVSVEKGGRGYNSYFVLGLVRLNFCYHNQL
jgi:hypothetical protein